jgi:hypothetical protein
MAINTSALNSTLQSRVDALDAATDTKEVLLLSKALEAAAGSTSVSDILSEGVVQVNNVNSEGSAQVANVQNEGATQRASVGAVLGDYTLTTGFKTVGGTSIVGSGDIATLPSGGSAGQIIKKDASNNPSWGDANNASTLTTGTLNYDVFPVDSVVQIKHLKFDSKVVSSGKWVDIGMDLAITPKYANSKILVTVNMQFTTNGTTGGYEIYRNGARREQLVGTSYTTRISARAGCDGTSWVENATAMYYDDADTTSAITYDIRMGTHDGRTWYVNRSGGSSSSTTWDDAAVSSTMTLTEIRQ